MYNVVSRLLIREALEFLEVVRLGIIRTPDFFFPTSRNERVIARFRISRSLSSFFVFFFLDSKLLDSGISRYVLNPQMSGSSDFHFFGFCRVMRRSKNY